MIINTSTGWLIIAAFISSISIYFPALGYLLHIAAFFFSAKAFASLFEINQSKIHFGDVITLAFLSCMVMLIYNLGFQFFINMPYTVSLARFIVSWLIIAAYCIFGAMLITILVSTLALVSHSQTTLVWAFKVSVKIWKEHVIDFIGFLPLGIMLFSSFNIPQLMYGYLNLSIGPWVYIGLFLFLFLLSFHLAKNTFIKLPFPQQKVQQMQQAEIEEKQFLPNFAYAITIFLLISSPILSWVLFLSGATYGINYQTYLIMMWSWVFWLMLSIYFILIKKSQSTLIILMVFIPLVVTIISLFTLNKN